MLLVPSVLCEITALFLICRFGINFFTNSIPQVGFLSTGDFARAKSLIDMMLRSQTNEECPHDERDDGQNQTEDKNLKPKLITHTTLISSYSKPQGLEEALSLF